MPAFIREENHLSNLKPCNRRFRRARHSYLVRHPVCNMCKREAATILDHVVPHRGVPALFWDQSNWQGLCVHCHGVKTARELWGRGSVTASRDRAREIYVPPS
jgi:5-methylcytosine-specific restriction protein A